MEERHERGAAAVEFAFVFVLFTTLILLILQGGLLLLYQSSVSAAAREGARMMAISNEVDKATTAAEDAYMFGASGLSVTVSGTCPTPPDRSVTVSVVTQATPTFTWGLLGSPPLTGKGAMRCGG